MKKKIIRFCSFFLIFCVMFSVLSVFLCTSDRKDALHVRGFFYEPKDTIDVILIGASEVYTGFNSPLAWKEYGFTSYALSYAGTPCTLYKAMLQEALERQNPKLVVFEVNGFLSKDDYLENVSKRHTWYDNVPFTKTKINSMLENIPKKRMMEFILKIQKYHDNWRHPAICAESFIGRSKMKCSGISYTKCFATTTNIRETVDLKKSYPVFTKLSENCLRDLLQYCNDQGLKNVFLYRNPHCVNNQNPTVFNKISEIVSQYGYDFQNYENSFEKIGLNTQKDYYNQDHVNVYGMEKTTKFIGQYIVDHYDVKTEHSKEDIDRWNTCVEKMENIIYKAKDDIENNRKNVYYEISAYD